MEQVISGGRENQSHVTPDTSDYLSARYGLCILPGRYRNIMYCLSTNKDISFQFYDYTKRPDRLWDVCKIRWLPLNYESRIFSRYIQNRIRPRA